MRDLVKATGFPKSTLLHYVAEGLLPQPVRKGRNVAFYLPECIDRVRLIRMLQKHRRLSLAEIKDYMTRIKDVREWEAILQLERTVFGPETGMARYTRQELCAESGLDEASLNELIRASLIVPREQEAFDDEDVAAARMLARSLSWGMKPRDFSYYARCARELVDGDMALRARLIKGLATSENAVMTEEMTRTARLFREYLFDRTFMRAVAGMRTLT